MGEGKFVPHKPNFFKPDAFSGFRYFGTHKGRNCVFKFLAAADICNKNCAAKAYNNGNNKDYPGNVDYESGQVIKRGVCGKDYSWHYKYTCGGADYSADYGSNDGIYGVFGEDSAGRITESAVNTDLGTLLVNHS